MAPGLLVALSALLVVSPAAAQGAPQWTGSVLAGAAFGGDLAVGVRDRTVAGAVGLGLGRGVTLEAEVAVVPRLRWLAELDLLVGTGALLYHPLRLGRVVPYALAGASLARLDDRAPGGRSAVELAYDLGGGAWVMLGGPVSARADLRFVHIDNAPNVWRATAGLTVAFP